MVIDRIRARGERFKGANRGQMLLIGALLIAVTIVALALVINTVLYTENVGSEQEATQINDVDEFTHEVSRNARSIMLRVNHVERNRSMSKLRTDVNQSITDYSDGLARSFAMEGTVYANVSYRRTVENGTRIVQWQDRNFSRPNDAADGDWDIVPDPTQIGWFLLNVNVQDTSTTNSTISVAHGSETLNYTVNQSDTSNLSVTVTDETGAVLDNTSCQSIGGRTLLDLYGGTSPTGECSFTGIREALDPPMTGEIVNGTEITGQYAIVTAHNWSPSWNVPSGGSYTECDTTTRRICLTPAVWKGSVDLTYQSSSVQLSQQRNVSVYGGSP